MNRDPLDCVDCPGCTRTEVSTHRGTLVLRREPDGWSVAGTVDGRPIDTWAPNYRTARRYAISTLTRR
jgi:hypothetical protein